MRRTAAKALGLDRKIMLRLRNPAEPSTPIGPLWLREVARDITSLGSTTLLGILSLSAAGYLYLTDKPLLACVMLGAVIGGVALNTLLKSLCARSRPDVIRYANRFHTASFPSGHAALSALTYLTIASLVARDHPSFTLSLFLISLATALTLATGISRIYLGVHHPTDVLAGWCFGGAWAIVVYLLMRSLG